MLPSSILEAWSSLAPEVRAALVATEMSSVSTLGANTSVSSYTSSGSSDDSGEKSSNSEEEIGQNNKDVLVEECAESGTKTILRPLERAPENVFEITKTTSRETIAVQKTASSTVTTKTTVMTTSKGWRNVFTLPISYDVNMVPSGTLLDPSNMQLLDSTGVHPEGYNTRFAVIDAAVDEIYGNKIRSYFTALDIELTTIVIQGGEPDKRPAVRKIEHCHCCRIECFIHNSLRLFFLHVPQAVDTILDAMCAYKLRRREPFLAIGGGVVLDIAGMAACLYRRGVPFVRVPTTLLAIVDASVGVKNGVDYCCCVTDETYKNRIGSFYAPSSCLLDTSFITTQDMRNVSNGFGEILKLALVRSVDLFELLETHGRALVESQFAPSSTVPDGVAQRIIDLSIQIMLEELGPNLWEYQLERCVDYGHTFSKLLEMVPGVDIMHGEAVNIDGFLCCLLSYLRGFISMDTVNRVFRCMQSLQLPTTSSHLTSQLAWQSCKDAVEHRNGAQRIPLITEIGDSVCVSDVTPEELDRALDLLAKFDHIKSGE
jgi:3-dehydroquinate synthetase